MKTGARIGSFFSLVASLLALLCAALSACAPEEYSPPQASGDPDKGTTLVPRSTGGGEAVKDAFYFAGLAGRKLEHHEGILWTKLSGQSNSSVHRAAVEIAGESRRRGMDFVLCLLPATGADRSEIVLPPGYRGLKSFANPEIRDAYREEVSWLVQETKPAHIALATEIDGYYLKHPLDFDNFASLYKETYDDVKALSPSTKVFVYFQYESFFRSFPGGESTLLANLSLLAGKFEPKLDSLGLSSYPGLMGNRFKSPSEIPDDYYSRILQAVRKTVFFAELGYPSRTSAFLLPSSETVQADFVNRFFVLTAPLDVDCAIWSFLHDPDLSPSSPGWPGPALAEFFGSHGLRNKDGSEKLSWQDWLAG